MTTYCAFETIAECDNGARAIRCRRCGRQFPCIITKPTDPLAECKSDKSIGLGDTVAKVIKKVTGVKPCGGCQKRKEKLNEVFPYKS